MKKLISLLLLLAMGLALCACDSFTVTFNPNQSTSNETSSDETTPEIPGTLVDPTAVSFELVPSTEYSFSFRVIIQSEAEDAYIDLKTFFNEFLSQSFFDGITYDEMLEDFDWFVDNKLADGATKLFNNIVISFKLKIDGSQSPEESSSEPEESSSEPEESSSNPEESSSEPEESSSNPEESSSNPEGTSSTPEETSSTPNETTPPEGPITPDEKVTIVFYHTMGETLRCVLDKYIMEFNKLYPDITVLHKQVGGYDDVRQQIKIELTIGEHPNIAYCYPDHVAEYNIAHAVKTLDDFIGSTVTVTRADGTVEQVGLTQEQIDNFIDGFYAEGSAYGDGKMYTLPFSKSTEVLYYNKTFFEQYGLSVPTTWDEIEQLCRILKELDPDCIPLGYDSEANWFITMCQQYNSPYTSATGNHYLFDNETNRGFVAKFREWYQKGYVTTLELSGMYTSGLFTMSPYEIGNCYMCIASSAGANHQIPRNYDGSLMFEVGIAPIPQVNLTNPKVISQGPSLCIFKDTNEAEVLASWLFMKFLTTNVDFQAEFSMASGYMPVLENVTEHPVYKEELAQADGYYGLPLLALKVAFEQADAYFTTPAFNGSATAREEVGYLLQYCLTDPSCSTLNGIKKAFEEAVYECEYECPSQTPDIPDIPDNPPAFDVDAAADYIHTLYKDKNVTPIDFEVTSKVSILGTVYNVTWAVDTPRVTISQKDDDTYIVNVNEESATELNYTLTATILAPDGTTAIRSFSLIVPKYYLTSFEEYMNAKQDEIVVVRGIVVAMNAKSAGNRYNNLFLADIGGKGGYYCYSITQDPIADLGIEIGMTVEVAGPVAPYSGMQEIKGGIAQIVSYSKQDVPALDITDMFVNGESLVNYVGLPVTIKGVQIASQNLDTPSAQYLYFELNGITSYLRTYVSDFPTTLAVDYDGVSFTSPHKYIIDAAHASHFGWKANVTGILVLYSNQPYLVPMSENCFEYLEPMSKTPQEKIAESLGELKMETSFTYDTKISLPTSAVYPDVTITWTIDDSYGCVSDLGNGEFLILIPEGSVTVNFIATATCGFVSDSKIFSVKLSQEAIPVQDAIEMGLGMGHNVFTYEKYVVSGIITEIYNTTYGNMRITDENGNILTIYGSYSADGTTRFDKLENKPSVGDYVVLFGILGQYNGTPQMKNGWIISFTAPTSVEDAIAIGASKEHNTYTEEKHVVTGVITEVYNTIYGNMRITDEYGNILTIYGTWNSNGWYRYDAMSVQPVAGDTVTVYGILGQYNGTSQMKNGWIVAHTPATPDVPEEPEETTPAEPEIPDVPAESEISVADAIAIGASKDHNTYTEGKYYVTGVITEVYNTTYGNMKITDGNGNILTIYGTFNADGTARYDAMTVKPVAGDTVTIYGIVGQYNGTPQIKNGWIVAHTPAEGV